VPTVTPSSGLGRLPIEIVTPAKLAPGSTDNHSASAAVTAASSTGSVNGLSEDAGGPRPLPGTAAASSGARMALVSVVAPSVAGGVIESEVEALAGPAPVRDVPPTAADAGAGETIGAGSDPDAAPTGPELAGAVAVVAAGLAAPATTSAPFTSAVEEAADEVTSVPVDVDVTALVTVLCVLV
jgi:hypothetical protein